MTNEPIPVDDMIPLMPTATPRPLPSKPAAPPKPEPVAAALPKPETSAKPPEPASKPEPAPTRRPAPAKRKIASRVADATGLRPTRKQAAMLGAAMLSLGAGLYAMKLLTPSPSSDVPVETVLAESAAPPPLLPVQEPPAMLPAIPHAAPQANLDKDVVQLPLPVPISKEAFSPMGSTEPLTLSLPTPEGPAAVARIEKMEEPKPSRLPEMVISRESEPLPAPAIPDATTSKEPVSLPGLIVTAGGVGDAPKAPNVAPIEPPSLALPSAPTSPLKLPEPGPSPMVPLIATALPVPEVPGIAPPAIAAPPSFAPSIAPPAIASPPVAAPSLAPPSFAPPSVGVPSPPAMLEVPSTLPTPAAPAIPGIAPFSEPPPRLSPPLPSENERPVTGSPIEFVAPPAAFAPPAVSPSTVPAAPPSVVPEIVPEAVRPLPTTPVREQPPAFVESAPVARPTTNEVKLTNTPERPVRTDYDVGLHEPRAGETYETISEEWYNSRKLAAALRAYNRNKALQGQGPVEVPPIDVLRKAYPQFANGDARTSTVPSATTEWTTPGQNEPVYRPVAGREFVIPSGGMTMREASRASLGSESRWGELFEVNPQITNPSAVIPAGTRLRLP